MHDHAESERRRQEDEHRAAVSSLQTERQVNLVLEGALRRIADPSGGTFAARQIADDALAAERKLRAK